jgi:hypothetical protein
MHTGRRLIDGRHIEGWLWEGLFCTSVNIKCKMFTGIYDTDAISSVRRLIPVKNRRHYLADGWRPASGNGNHFPAAVRRRPQLRRPCRISFNVDVCARWQMDS